MFFAVRVNLPCLSEFVQIIQKFSKQCQSRVQYVEVRLFNFYN